LNIKKGDLRLSLFLFVVIYFSVIIAITSARNIIPGIIMLLTMSIFMYSSNLFRNKQNIASTNIKSTFTVLFICHLFLLFCSHYNIKRLSSQQVCKSDLKSVYLFYYHCRSCEIALGFSLLVEL
jgi:hypothetical protein